MLVNYMKSILSHILNNVEEQQIVLNHYQEILEGEGET